MQCALLVRPPTVASTTSPERHYVRVWASFLDNDDHAVVPRDAPSPPVGVQLQRNRSTTRSERLAHPDALSHPIRSPERVPFGLFASLEPGIQSSPSNSNAAAAALVSPVLSQATTAPVQRHQVCQGQIEKKNRNFAHIHFFFFFSFPRQAIVAVASPSIMPKSLSCLQRKKIAGQP